MTPPAGRTTLTVLRRSLFALLLVGFLGTIGELLLSEHTEDAWQLVPIVLLSAGVPLICLAGWRRGVFLRLFQGLMVLFVASGGVGAWLHLKAKSEFVLERAPSLRGMELLLQSLEGSSPPLLAPGAMIALGLLGLTWTYRQGASS